VCVYVCLCVFVCVCRHNFVVGDDSKKDIFALQLKFIQTICGVNKCTSCRQISKDYNTQHTRSGFFIYTESDMLHQEVQRLKMYKFIIITVGFKRTILQYSPLKEKRGKYNNKTEQQGTTSYKH